MKLHSASNKPDWERVAAKKRNHWQRLAMQTNGVVTPGNTITILGLLLVFIGCALVLHKYYLPGFIALLIGRLGDIADGWAAEYTQTKSSLGATIDASADKVATFTIMITLVAVHVLPLFAAILTILVHAVILYPSSIAVLRKITIRPAVTGKIGMAITWASVLSYVISLMLDSVPGALFRLLGLVLILTGFALTTHAASLYFKQYLRAK